MVAAGRSLLCRSLRILTLLSLILTPACVTTPGMLESVGNGGAELVDLTHTLSPQLPVQLDTAGFQSVPFKTLERDGLSVQRFAISDNTGTHIEAPARLISSQTSVDKLPLRQFMGPGVLLDVTAKVKQDPTYKVSREDIAQWESDHGPIPNDAILIVRTDWSQRFGTPEKYGNVQNGKPVYPGISEEAVDFLVRERRVQALGIDTASLYAGSGNTPGQRLFLSSGRYHINNLTGLEAVPAKGATFLAVPLKVQGGPSAPARVLAIIPRVRSEVEPGKKKVEQSTEMGSDSAQPGMMR